MSYGDEKLKFTFTHYRLLYQADSSNLNELLLGMKMYGFPKDREWPPLPLREARKALLELIEAGCVDLYVDVQKTMRRAEALEVLKRDEPWKTLDFDSPDYYEVGITDEGWRVFEELKPKFGDVGVIGKTSQPEEASKRRSRTSGRRRK